MMYKVEYVDENMASIILCAWKRMLYFGMSAMTVEDTVQNFNMDSLAL